MTGKLLLVGCGKMGGALLNGWLTAGSAQSVAVIEPAGLPDGIRDCAAIHHYVDVTGIPADFAPDVVVLAIKPQMMDNAIGAYRRFVAPGTVFLSIAAGKTIGYYQKNLGDATAVVRAMPNTPAAIGRGMTVAVANALVPATARSFCETLLHAVGDVAWVEDEALIDAVTAVSGSGPAYVFLLVEAMAAAGCAVGLPADLAMRLARATVVGSGALLDQSVDTAEALRRAVTSPGGTTQAALNVLMDRSSGVGPLMEAAVKAAAERSRELAG